MMTSYATAITYLHRSILNCLGVLARDYCTELPCELVAGIRHNPLESACSLTINLFTLTFSLAIVCCICCGICFPGSLSFFCTPSLASSVPCLSASISSDARDVQVC
ncbi:hypothetical protein IQ06DRAFT_118265 [Phaeosphaeriaceae sp. SRC1lsM3a]|nr:hypothetical protein IQ06DRAFT_118265 [Stagonospora sp. SRC1lsM3a]